MYHLSVVSVPKALHIEECKCVQTLTCLIKCSFFTKTGHPEVKWSIVYLFIYVVVAAAAAAVAVGVVVVVVVM